MERNKIKDGIDYSFYEKLVVIGENKVGKTSLIENLFSINNSQAEKPTSKNNTLLITFI
jgi:GTPase SAR1 family protein